MTTYPLPTLAAAVGPTGISAPSFDDAYLSLCASYRAIYGSDVVLSSDTQDGQWIAIIAQAVTDVNAAAIAVYNSFSPASAQGTGLSSVVKINGIKREDASFSSVPVTITGTAGTTITKGSVGDAAGNVWLLPDSVAIPPSSSITVTATAKEIGATAAAAGEITKILTPTRGWLTVSNPEAAAPGAAVESDATLRGRQSISTAISARTPMETIAAAVANIAGVTRLNYSENPTGAPNSDGVPAHTFCLVVEGGDAVTIARTIANNKLGAGTVGTITETILDSRGIPSVVSFDAPTYKRIIASVAIKPLPGYTVAIGNTILAAIAYYITTGQIGSSISINDVIVAAVEGSGARAAFRIPPDGLKLALFGNTLAATDVPIAFNEAATCDVADVTLSIVS